MSCNGENTVPTVIETSLGESCHGKWAYKIESWKLKILRKRHGRAMEFLYRLSRITHDIHIRDFFCTICFITFRDYIPVLSKGCTMESGHLSCHMLKKKELGADNRQRQNRRRIIRKTNKIKWTVLRNCAIYKHPGVYTGL